jgi:hypothetical protein
LEQIAIVYITVGSVGLLAYVLSSIFVYVGEKDFERSEASTRVNTDDVEASISPTNTSQHCRGLESGSVKSDSPRVACARSLFRGNFAEGSKTGSNRSVSAKRQLLI